MAFLETLDTIAHAAEGLSDGLRHPFTSAVILAGGVGSRMGQQNGRTKQFLMLGGEPVILRSVRMFEACDDIDEIILVVRREEQTLYPPMLRDAGIRKVTQIVPGGETRQDSAFAGLQKVDDRCEFLAVHDGARPLILPRQISDIAREARRIGAAAAGAPAKDTIKELDLKTGYIRSTPDRKTLWLAATPQIFKVEEYRAAIYLARQNKTAAAATDDCSLVEAIGFPVRLVDTGYQNLKITTPEDLCFAEAVLAMRQQETDRRADL